MRGLLDVNVLVALLDSEHVHHERAQNWLRENIHFGWAACPLTENGCVRILSQPRYPNPCKVPEAAARLREAQATSWFAFWPDSLSLLNPATVRVDKAHGAAQLTDIYLLALAVAHGGRLVTFDARIPLPAVSGASRANLLIL